MRQNLDKTKNTANVFLGHILAIEINDFFPNRNKHEKNRSRVIPNILHLLDHIDKHRAEGNFFITPDIAKDFPEVVSLVSSRGHEIGLCCDYHEADCSGDIKGFRESLESITNKPANGVMLKSDEAQGRTRLRLMAESGFDYCLTDFDMPMRGETSLPLNIAYNNNISISVFPPSVYTLMGIRLGFGNPGKIRLYPFWFLDRCLRYYTNREMPAIINLPLWEFDPHIPRRVLSPLQSLKSYGNLSIAEFKLTRMLLEYDFVKIPTILGIDDKHAV